jgi:HD-GYP domain-containing protein (c-di-GMP phosphodiesterase class II)
MMVQQDAPARAHYGVTHAVHAAVAALLAARRLTLDEARTQTLLRAALTMNWSMLDLQGRLAHQEQPPTPMQKQQIAGHPDRSVAMLQAAGVTDEAWLAAVRDHHERDGGGGYPRGCERPDENARMLHVCDVFAAKFAARAGRAAMPGSSAARSLFAAYPKSDVAAALLKEFGLYPPGCFVELQNGERGVVVYRGSGAHTPVVDVLHGRHGEPTLAPVRRDTAHKGHGIAGPLAPQRITVRVAPEKLFAERSP